MIVEIFLAIVLILVYLFWRDNFSCRNGIPGPMRLPIIGNLHQIASTGEKHSFVAFDILARKYGPLMSLKMGMKEALIVTSFEDMSALLTRSECNGRVLEDFLKERSFGKQIGIIFGNGETWKAVRRFTMRSLRDFGFGKRQSIDTVMTDEINDFMEKVRKDAAETDGKVHVHLLFNLSLINVLWSMVADKRYPYDSPKLNHLVDLNERMFKAGTFGSDISIAFPFLRFLMPETTGAKEFTKGFKALHEYFGETIAEHRAKPHYAEAPECLVDCFLQKIDEMKKNPEEEVFTEDQLLVVVLDLFMAGSETLSGSLSYAILFMILHPEIQKKVQQEIDEIVPKSEDVVIEHKSRMIYTQAVLMEVLRVGDIVPIIPPRLVMQDFNYKGYFIPKGTTIIPNLYSVFTSEKYFKNAKEFIPERFIDSKGGILNSEYFEPFGFGKRFCMGESQASTALFLYFTNFLRNFDIMKIPNQPDPTTEPLAAFTLTPQPFDMIVKPRN